jgi:uncharacterized protein involved in exopolysaccharide biosynthesis
MNEELGLYRRTARTPTPTLRDILAVLFRQRRVVIFSFVTIFAGTILYGWLAPSYQAEMKVIVRKGRVDPIMTPVPTPSPEFIRGEVSEEEINSEVTLLRDESVLRSVVIRSGLANHQTVTGLFSRDDEGARIERAVRRLASHLEVEPGRKTNLIRVSYRSSDPGRSADVLRMLGDAYLERHLQLRRPSGELKFFEQQMTESKRALDAVELRLTDFIRRHGVVSASLQRDLALQRMSDAELARLQTKMAIADNSKRIGFLQTKLQTLPERRTAQVRTSDNPLLLEKMKSRLLELELRRTELVTKFKPSYRLVLEVDQQIADTKAAIASERLAPVQDQTTEQDPSHDWVEAELIKAQVELDALEARDSTSEKLLSDSRMAAEQLGMDSIKQEELLREVKAAEDKYLLYAGKREESRIGDALDQGGILNVAIAEPPVAPALPIRSSLSIAFMGLLLASTLSTGIAFATDFLDPAFRTPDEVVACLGTPVLASLPRRNLVGGLQR